MNGTRRFRANSMVSLRKHQGNYFQVSATEQPMNLIEVTRTHLNCNTAPSIREHCDVTNYDAFAAITQIAIDGYKFSRNRITPHYDGTKTYSFRCIGCGRRENVYSDSKNSNYELLPSNKNIMHLPQCKRYTTDEANTRAMIEEMRTFAIQLKQNNYDYGPCQLLARVLQEQNRYNKDNPHMMIPIIKRETIESWFKQSSPIKSSQMKLSNIPQNLEFLNNTRWVKMSCHIDGKAYIILSFPEMYNYAAVTTRLLIDGTFKSRPTDFAQVLNGMGYLGNVDRYCPIFHVLLDDQKAETYLTAFKLVFAFFNFRNLISIHTDYEAAELLALKSLFRIDENGQRKYHIQGCLFHFTQRILMNLHELENESLFRYKKAFLNTPYLSDSDFLDFMDYMKNIKEIKEFYSYFKDQWGPHGRVSREFWAVPSDDKFINLTNDGVERYNKEANVELDHPNFELFLRKTAEIDLRILENIHLKSVSQSNTGATYEKKTSYEAKKEINHDFPKLFGKCSKKSNESRILIENETEELLDVSIPFDFSNSFIPKKSPIKKSSYRRPGQKKKGNARKNREQRYSEKMEILMNDEEKRRPRYSGTYKDRDNSEEEELIDEIPKNKKAKRIRRSTQ